MSIAVIAAVLLCALPGVASAAKDCPSTATTKAFKGFSDNNDYSLVAGGNFESALTGWAVPNAAKVKGNESYKVGSSLDDESLTINPSGQAVSPSFCVSAAHPSFRFFARRTSGTWGNSLVKVRWSDSAGVHDTVVASVSPTLLWAPTPSLPLAGVLPIPSGGTLNVQIVIDPDNSGGGIAIDDLYVDPYRK